MNDPTQPGTQMSLLTISPAMARDYLKHTTHRNRKLNAVLVSKYAEDMKAKRWRVDGGSIKLGPKGELMDGQHRLHAILEANVSIETFVAHGVALEAFVTIDSGKSRTFANVLQIMEVPNSNDVAALCRAWISFERYGQFTVTNAAPATNQELLACFEENSELFAEAIRAVGTVRSAMHGSKSAWAHAWIKMGEVSIEDRDFFFERIKDGQSLVDGDAIYALRRLLLRWRQEQHGTIPLNLQGQVIRKAWNKYRANEKTLVLQIKAGEEFQALL